MHFFQRFAALGLSIFILTACSPEDMPIIRTPDGDQIRVEVAFSPEDRQQGLMFREKLDPDAGMLFVFEDEMLLAFWMKNTLIPLDVIYIDSDQQIVDIQTMTPCEEDPCPNYPAAVPARYALEINAGKASALGLEVGDLLSFSLPTYDEAER